MSLDCLDPSEGSKRKHDVSTPNEVAPSECHSFVNTPGSRCRQSIQARKAVSHSGCDCWLDSQKKMLCPVCSEPSLSRRERSATRDGGGALEIMMHSCHLVTNTTSRAQV